MQRTPMKDDGWATAYDLAVEASQPWFAKARPEKVVIGPFANPQGQTIPYLVRISLEGVQNASSVGWRLISRGALVTDRSAAGLTSYLATIGFPAQKQPRDLLFAVVSFFGVLPGGWQASPLIEGWGVVDEYKGDLGKPVELTYDDSGATMTLYLRKLGDGEGGVSEPVLHRLELRFDSKARLTMEESRQAGDAWEPVATP